MPWLFLAYPLLAHLATLIGSPLLAWLALTVFVGVPLLPGLMRGALLAWLILLGATAVFYFCARSGLARYLMYVPPILIPAAVLAVFARSLRPGQVPLISRVAQQIRGAELPPDLARYTRHVTFAWVLFLAVLALGSLALAVWATPKFWSLMTNVVEYLLIAAAFPLEYAYRRWRFRHLEHESFPTLVKALFRTRVY